MAINISTGTAPELLWPGIREIFGNTYNQWDAKYNQIAEVITSDKAFEKFQGITGFGLAAVKNQGASVAYDSIYQGFQKEAVAVTYGLGATVTMEMMEDDQYNVINRIPEALAKSVRHTQEQIVANQFNSGFATATSPETTADGLSVFNTAHRLVAGGTFSNMPAVAADLTMTALEDAVVDISNYNDDRGLPMMANAKKLVVPTSLQNVARKILETEYAVGSADNDVNVVSKAMLPLQLIVNPYLTDTDAWFLITDVPNGILYVNRKAPELKRDNDFDTDNLKFKAITRFDVVTVDARGLYGSAGA
jgi:phage major head subunit gpT-like protein